MGSGAGEKENQIVSVNTVDQEPVGFDVTFHKTGIIADEFVNTIFLFKFFSGGDPIDDTIQLFKIASAFGKKF